ncbi:MAG: efflux RND transporter periplasmic adaptor subunit [Flavobacteriales bacterium]
MRTANLYAPIDGYITKVNVNNGTYVSPSDTILEIVNTEHIHLELLVFEKDILNVKKGQKILFKIPEASNKTFAAEVYLVGTTVDETTRIVKVHAHIENEEDTNFIVGMFVEASILTAEVNSFTLPNEAVFEIDKNYFSLVLNTKKNDTFYFEKVKLDIGKQTETHTSILNMDALSNKNILTKGGFMLLEESSE